MPRGLSQGLLVVFLDCVGPLRQLVWLLCGHAGRLHRSGVGVAAALRVALNHLATVKLVLENRRLDANLVTGDELTAQSFLLQLVHLALEILRVYAFLL